MGEYSVIGKRVHRVESREMVTGRMRYINDVTLPGMLYGKILGSPYAHARILNIDTIKAERLLGVMAVVTAKDTPKAKFSDQPGFEDEYPLAVDKVRFMGDQVAAVAATREDIAEEAVKLIDVTYEQLPAVFDVEEAMKPGAPRVHDDVEDNVYHRVRHIFGDIEKGFKESDHIREDRFKTPMVVNATLGTRCAVADFEPGTGKLNLYSDTQFTYLGRPVLAQALGIPVEKIRIIRPYVPGAFGGRANIAIDVAVCASFLSMKTGRPVKIEHTRKEEFCVQRGRQPLVVEFKTGVKKNGTLVAVQCRHLTNSGAYAEFGVLNTLQNAGILDLCLRVPNVKFEAFVVYTNTIAGLSLRALMNNPFGFALYSHMDMIAEDLGMDVVDFYLKNTHKTGDETTCRYKLASCGISECIQKVVEGAGWKDNHGKLPKNRGIGFGIGGHTAGAFLPVGERSTAVVNIDELGEVKVLSGRGEYGNAPTNMICMCVAEELGLRLEDVGINYDVDTEVVPYEDGNYASRGTVGQGRAAIAAAQDVRRQLFEIVAEKFGVRVEDIEAKGGRIFVKGSPDKGMPFKDAVKTYSSSGRLMPLVGRGHYDPPGEWMDEKTGEGNFSVAWGFGAQAAEVEVDTETGHVKVLEVVTANDCGKVLNPLHLEGSSEGGIVMSLGMALFEEVRYDEKGKVLATSFPDYGLPTSLQTPPKIKHLWVETNDPYGPYGAKGITEVVSLPTASAIANAIYDAVGVRIKDLPITPEKVLYALEKKKSDLE